MACHSRQIRRSKKGIKVSNTTQEAETRLAEITKAANSEPTESRNWHGQGVWKELLWRPSNPVKRMLIAAVGINFFMQASGNDAVIYCCPEVFKSAGIHSKKQLFGVNVIMGMAKTSFVLVSAVYLTDLEEDHSCYWVQLGWHCR
ncbi:hypothetical protein Ddye_020879 [Dipteronia dyeriana]|uniref:Uncharacterized protein n=1 Tax=Dipteronia dyeriana TaxID=168575 RepID=A0AAD9U0J5_9ROSI|nr:hypothetical protein Ddye_020879 [Dipteronia dyeriana]